MPFTPDAITLTGGCNCGAIRYRIEIPPLAARPLNPSDETGQARLPMVATDSCNDCRRATGAVLPVFICVPADMLTMRVRTTESPSAAAKGAAAGTADEEEESSMIPADRLIYPAKGGAPPPAPLQIYMSSPDVSRTFCGTCGTSLSFSRKPMPPGSPDIFDVLLGSLDRASVEREELVPERHCWLSCRIPWVDRVLLGGNLPRHPRSRLNEEWSEGGA